MWHANNSYRLHAIQIVYKSQAMKAKGTTRKMVNILESKAVGSTVRYLETAWHLFVHV
jgi:hypothetical protein